MKISELNEYLSQFSKSYCSHKGLGCYEEVRIKTISTDANLVEEHFNKIKDAISKHAGSVVYVRHQSEIMNHLDEEGELNGYGLSTRLQFGEEGKCITPEQYENLYIMGAFV
ncbi:hypothetical protein LWE69_12695 [Paenibacillus sp. UKAQ_18]|nr:hypothetical protein [Paenibacillus sp. UKAQ_18]